MGLKLQLKDVLNDLHSSYILMSEMTERELCAIRPSIDEFLYSTKVLNKDAFKLYKINLREKNKEMNKNGRAKS